MTKWEQIIAESALEERKRQRKKMVRTARMLGAHRNALGTFHHEQKHRLMAARKAWFKLSKKLPTWVFSRRQEGQIATAVVGASFFLDVKFVDSATKKKNNTKRCGVEWYLGARDRSGEIWNKIGTRWQIFEFPAKMKPILDLVQIRQLNYLANLARFPDDRLEKSFSKVTLSRNTQLE